MKNGYYGPNDLYYSTVYGSGIYSWDGQFVQDPLCGDDGQGSSSPLLTNVITGEQFFMKRFACEPKLLEVYRQRILNPPVNDHLLWPSDMLHLEPAQQHACSLFVNPEYTDDPTPFLERTDDRGLLFPYGGYPPVISAQAMLKQIPSPNWTKPQVQTMAVGLVRTLETLNQCGYFYGDLHPSRIYYREDTTAILDFSGLIFSFRDAVGDQAAEICGPVENHYPMEFAEPAVVQKLIDHMDYHSQNYSLCALLFYMFLGRYAYDGCLLTGYVDDSAQTHYTKFRDYHKMPFFIFDPKDKSNHLGAFYEDEQVIALWASLPKPLKELFTATLCQANAQRTTPVNNPTPSTWLKCFAELGWIQDNKRNVP